MTTRNGNVLAIAEHSFADDGSIPNNPNFPLLVYSGVIDASIQDPALAFETLFSSNGWDKGWRNGIFDFPHYHSNTHEVLGIAKGSARVRFGGRKGADLELPAGDAVLIPAGTGHERLRGSEDLLVIGFYPPGPGPDLLRGFDANLTQIRKRILAVGRPTHDPVAGTTGGLLDIWAEA
jgi:uncharacterized protein YjlB